jgi:hypothetical protein
MFQFIFRIFTEAVERRPAIGYTGSAIGVGGGLAGISGIIETATKIGGLLSVLIGIAVGIVTLMVQIRIWRNGGKSTVPRKPNANRDIAS